MQYNWHSDPASGQDHVEHIETGIGRRPLWLYVNMTLIAKLRCPQTKTGHRGSTPQLASPTRGLVVQEGPYKGAKRAGLIPQDLRFSALGPRN